MPKRPRRIYTHIGDECGNYMTAHLVRLNGKTIVEFREYAYGIRGEKEAWPTGHTRLPAHLAVAFFRWQGYGNNVVEQVKESVRCLTP